MERGVAVLSLKSCLRFPCCDCDRPAGCEVEIIMSQGDCHIGPAQTLSFLSLGFPGGLRPHPSPIWDENSWGTPLVASGIFSIQARLILFSVSNKSNC